MGDSDVDGPTGGHQGLPQYLSAEYPLGIALRAAAAKEVYLDLLEVEKSDQ